MEKLIGDCEPLANAYKVVAIAPASEKCTILAQGLAEGLEACGCPENERKVLTANHILNLGFDASSKPAVVVPVTLVDDASLPAGDTWSDMVGNLDLELDAGTSLELGTKS